MSEQFNLIEFNQKLNDYQPNKITHEELLWIFEFCFDHDYFVEIGMAEQIGLNSGFEMKAKKGISYLRNQYGFEITPNQKGIRISLERLEIPVDDCSIDFISIEELRNKVQECLK
jgi:hypothetical protein